MIVNYVTVANETTASYRMRIDVPRKLIDKNDGEIITKESRTCDEEADVNVFSKHWNKEYNMTALKGSLTNTVFDITDDHFDRDLGEYYSFMAVHADRVTCNTRAMQKRIYDKTGVVAEIIPDPVTFPSIKHRYNNIDPKFLWYGNVVNIESVVPLMGILPNLTIITNAEILLPSNGTVKSVKWRPGLVERMIEDFDVVVLPKNSEPWALTKSPNRAVDALAAGKFVITDFKEVYGELNDYIYVGDMKKGIDFYMNEQYTVQTMVEQGQEKILTDYSSEHISALWAQTFKEI